MQRLSEDNQALCSLLGPDLERYFSGHIDDYEAAKRRWTSCSIEEWQTGANGQFKFCKCDTGILDVCTHFIEMSERFRKIVDFVSHTTVFLIISSTY